MSIESERVWRKVEKRDKRINELQNRVRMLESALATKDLLTKQIPIDVTRAVQHALCNIRMIPVFGVGKGNKIVEIRAIDDDQG